MRKGSGSPEVRERVQVMFRVSKAQHATWKEAADKDHRTLASWIRFHLDRATDFSSNASNEEED